MQFAKMEIGQVYFYTATILKWQKLLTPKSFKDIIINSLRFLVQKNKIRVFAFVIMPNHIHLIWEMLEMNGNEMPHKSFFKFTGQHFLKELQLHHPQVLPFFKVDDSTRQYQFWERNALPIYLYSIHICEQKLDYIHANPVQEKWALVNDYLEYHYSSAAFYETDSNVFDFLTHYKDRF